MSGAVSYRCRPLPRRGSHGDRHFDLPPVAPGQRRPRSHPDLRPAGCARGGFPTPPAAWPRLLLPALAPPSDRLDFIRRTSGVSVSRMAPHRFLTEYGLDQASRSTALPIAAAAAPPAAERPMEGPAPAACRQPAPTPVVALAAAPLTP